MSVKGNIRKKGAAGIARYAGSAEATPADWTRYGSAGLYKDAWSE